MKFPRTIFEFDGCCGFLPHKIKSGGKDLRSEPLPEIDMADRHRFVCSEEGPWMAHRLSYSLNVAPIPRNPLNRKEGLVLHSCDRKWCIKPEHLSLGTASRNARENVERNEGWRIKRKALMKGRKFPERSEEALKRIGAASSKRLKKMWADNPEKMRELCKRASEARWRS